VVKRLLAIDGDDKEHFFSFGRRGDIDYRHQSLERRGLSLRGLHIKSVHLRGSKSKKIWSWSTAPPSHQPADRR